MFGNLFKRKQNKQSRIRASGSTGGSQSTPSYNNTYIPYDITPSTHDSSHTTSYDSGSSDSGSSDSGGCGCDCGGGGSD